MKHAAWILLLLALPALAWAEEEPVAKEHPDDPVAVIKTSMGDVHVELFVKEAPKTVGNFLDLAEGRRAWKDPETGEMVERPYYDGLLFHRVIKDFMIQGGCPLGTGTGSPGFKFEDEIDAAALGLDEIKAFENGRPHGWMMLRSQQQFQEKILRPLIAQMGISPSAVEANQAKIRERLEAMTLTQAYELMGYRYQEGVGAHKPLKGVLAMANSGPNTNGSQFFINLKDTPWLTGKHTVFGKVIRGQDVIDKIGAVKTGERDRPVEDVKIISIRRLEE